MKPEQYISHARTPSSPRPLEQSSAPRATLRFTLGAGGHPCRPPRRRLYLGPRAARAPLDDRVEIERAGAREARVPVPAFLHDSLLSFEVAVHDSEALLESLRPFEVVGERPQKVAAHVGARLYRVSDLTDKTAQEADPALVVDLAVGARPVAV